MTRVLQVVTDTDRRGAQVFATDLAGPLRGAGWDVRTVALAPGAVGGLDLPTLGPRQRHPATLASLRRAMRSADVVIAHGSTTQPMTALAGFGSTTPVVYRQISDLRDWVDTPFRRIRVRAALSTMAAVAALHDGEATVLTTELGMAPARIAVIPNGVPAAGFAPVDRSGREAARARFGVPAAATVVAYVGALVAEKGVDRAVTAVTAIAGDDRPVHLLVVGDGPQRRDLEHLAARHPGTVTFAGSVPDPAAAYAAADVLVLPSRGGDSMPATLVEGGLCGLPSVTTDAGGIAEIVLDEVTGRVTPSQDDDAFDAALRDVLALSAADRMALGTAARAHCLAHFTIEAVGEAWVTVLRDVLDGTG